ncbi:hypothetical protein HK098_001590 [Nowakowskiella sp. JEL0407]|nr:hypothetical protein HK098_001590 [Nowakowskiella sp. JEL0407]
MSWDQYQGGPSNDLSRTTLWMGDLDPWMEENWIKQLWYSLGESVNVKMIRDKFTGGNAGYCFVEFTSNAAAAKHVTSLNGTLIPGTNRVFKLNWASGGGMNDRKDDRTPEFSVFVGDLGPEVTDFNLMQFFQARYMSIRSAKVVTDPSTGMSRGYGFVRFGDESEQQRAMTEMQGQYCGSRAMRISVATPKNKLLGTGQTPQMPQPVQQYYGMPPPQQFQYNDPHNTTVFVGGLSSSVNEEELKSYFQPFGEISYVKIPPGKGCGFVQYIHRQSAEMAIQQMNNYLIGGSRVRLSWGRSQSDKPMTPNSYRQSYIPPPMGYGYPPTGGPVPGMGMHAMGMPQQPEDPMQTVPVEKMNENYISQKEESAERSEIDPTGWRQPQVFAQ